MGDVARFQTAKTAFVPWVGLMGQMGGEYERADNFVQKAKAALRKIRAVYPALKLTHTKSGFLLHPSPTAIPPAPKRA
jgi:hypothetical protein